jgi:hypothetical protein
LLEPYDGITEVWWASETDMRGGLESEAGRAAAVQLLEDERHFIDFSRSRMFVTEEQQIF